MPVAVLDRETERALDYAGTLAPRVIAVHVRDTDDGPNGDLAGAWAGRGPAVPLLVLDDAPREWVGSFLRAMDVLRRTERTGKITVVVPPGLSATDLIHGSGSEWAETLRASGIAVRSAPRADLRA